MLHWNNFLSLITISFQADIYNAIFRSLEMCFWLIISSFITVVSDKNGVYIMRAQILKAFDLCCWLIIVCQRQAEQFWQPCIEEEDQRKEIGCFNSLKMPFCYWNQLRGHQTFVAAQLSEARQTKLFDAIWGSPVLRITIQLVDTLVIIHGTHAYYGGETEQWFSVVGSEQLEVLTSCQNNRPMHFSQQWNNGGL